VFSLLPAQGLHRALRDPRGAARVLSSWLLARYYLLRYRLAGVRIEVGRNFRCEGRLVIRGRGTITIGDDVVFRTNVRRVFLGSDGDSYVIRIGDRCYVNGASISCMDRIEIGAGAVFGRAELVDHDLHDPRDPHRARRVTSAPIFIGERAWIGNDAMILKGVTIGSESVVGARTVVRRSLPQRVVAIGNPAQIVKEIEADADLEQVRGEAS